MRPLVQSYELAQNDQRISMVERALRDPSISPNEFDEYQSVRDMHPHDIQVEANHRARSDLAYAFRGSSMLIRYLSARAHLALRFSGKIFPGRAEDHDQAICQDIDYIDELRKDQEGSYLIFRKLRQLSDKITRPNLDICVMLITQSTAYGQQLLKDYVGFADKGTVPKSHKDIQSGLVFGHHVPSSKALDYYAELSEHCLATTHRLIHHRLDSALRMHFMGMACARQGQSYPDDAPRYTQCKDSLHVCAQGQTTAAKQLNAHCKRIMVQHQEL